jgi:hypothetical protein
MREANNHSSEPNKMVFRFEKSSTKFAYFATLPSKQDIRCLPTPMSYTVVSLLQTLPFHSLTIRTGNAPWDRI